MNAIHALYDEGLQELLTRMLSLGTFLKQRIGANELSSRSNG